MRAKLLRRCVADGQRDRPVRATGLVATPITSQLLRCHVEWNLGVGYVGKIINSVENYLNIQNCG